MQGIHDIKTGPAKIPQDTNKASCSTIVSLLVVDDHVVQQWISEQCLGTQGSGQKGKLRIGMLFPQPGNNR